MGIEGTLEFLHKLGFRPDDSTTKLCIEADQPPRSVIEDALTVIDEKIDQIKQVPNWQPMVWCSYDLPYFNRLWISGK